MHVWIAFSFADTPDSQDGLFCEQKQKSMPADSAPGEALGQSFYEAHGK